MEGGVKEVRKPQNRTEKPTKTAIPHRILPKYRNRSNKWESCPLFNTWGPSFHYKCDLMYSNNSVRCYQSFLLIWRDASCSSPPWSWIYFSFYKIVPSLPFFVKTCYTVDGYFFFILLAWHRWNRLARRSWKSTTGHPNRRSLAEVSLIAKGYQTYKACLCN